MQTLPIIASSFTWFGWLSGGKIDHHTIHIFHGVLVFVALLVAALLYRWSLKTVEQEVVPSAGVGLKNILQSTVENLLGLIEGIIPHHGADYFPLLGAVFIYIFVSNMLGLIPGLLPPTENFNTNAAVAICVFIYFNAMGIKKQGAKKYLAHFMGPMMSLVVLIFPIEIIGTLIRPFSLSLRLFGNINGDHMVLGNISEMVPLIIPVIFLAFGIFVSFIQAFVFTLLSSVYVALAVDTDQH